MEYRPGNTGDDQLSARSLFLSGFFQITRKDPGNDVYGAWHPVFRRSKVSRYPSFSFAKMEALYASRKEPSKWSLSILSFAHNGISFSHPCPEQNRGSPTMSSTRMAFFFARGSFSGKTRPQISASGKTMDSYFPGSGISANTVKSSNPLSSFPYFPEEFRLHGIPTQN